MTAVPRLLEWARALQAVAQSGLAWEPHAYDRERYEEVRRIAAEMLAHPDGDVAEVASVLAAQDGHATPKIDVRGAVFDGDRILLVQERLEDGRWALPGGWADVGEAPAAAVEREVREESGYGVEAVRLLALYERDRRLTPGTWSIWNHYFLCERTDAARGELHAAEILDARFFPLDALPELAPRKASRELLARLFELRDHPEWPAQFD